MKIRTRIAPSPTGIAHLGTAYTALRNWALARKSGGKFIIRIEDTDRERYVEGAVEVVLDALKWLGIDHDEGPQIGGPHEPYTQSSRLEIYKKYADELVKSGNAYYCFCTKDRLDEVRKAAQLKKQIPMYDRHCLNLSDQEVKDKLSKGDGFVIRLKIKREDKTRFHDAVRGDIEFDNSVVDDQVLLKSDGYPTYHLAVVVDDHLMEVTHVVRGEEWLPSTPKHIMLYKAFGWELPIFAHLPIIRNKDKSKMSKRKNDVSISSYKEKGYLPEALINFLALMGWSHPDKKEVFSKQEFIDTFTLERTQTTAPSFDLDKLNWLNGVYIRNLKDQELFKKLSEFIPSDCSDDLAKSLLPLIKERLVTLSDFEKLTYYFYRDIDVDKSSLLIKGAAEDLVDIQLSSTKEALSNLSDYSHENIEKTLRNLAVENGWKPKQYFMMLRLAVTGEKATPPLFETIEVLGKDKTISRLS